jgi:hypothetical protein
VPAGQGQLVRRLDPYNAKLALIVILVIVVAVLLVIATNWIWPSPSSP